MSVLCLNIALQSNETRSRPIGIRNMNYFQCEHVGLFKDLHSKFFNGPLFNLFSSSETNITIFTTNICEKCPSSVLCWDLNPQPSDHESPPVTTRPGLPSTTTNFHTQIFSDFAILKIFLFNLKLMWLLFVYNCASFLVTLIVLIKRSRPLYQLFCCLLCVL